MNCCYSVKEAARILDVHPRTIYRLIKIGKLKAINISLGDKNIWKIHDTAIQQFIVESYVKQELI